jgi:hypothetical protein
MVFNYSESPTSSWSSLGAYTFRLHSHLAFKPKWQTAFYLSTPLFNVTCFGTISLILTPGWEVLLFSVLGIYYMANALSSRGIEVTSRAFWHQQILAHKRWSRSNC